MHNQDLNKIFVASSISFFSKVQHEILARPWKDLRYMYKPGKILVKSWQEKSKIIERVWQNCTSTKLNDQEHCMIKNMLCLQHFVKIETRSSQDLGKSWHHASRENNIKPFIFLIRTLRPGLTTILKNIPRLFWSFVLVVLWTCVNAFSKAKFTKSWLAWHLFWMV